MEPLEVRRAAPIKGNVVTGLRGQFVEAARETLGQSERLELGRSRKRVRDAAAIESAAEASVG